MTAVLVIGQDAEPTGSGERLLALLDAVRDRDPSVELHVFLLHGGPLVHQLQAVGPTTVVDWYDRRTENRRAAAVLRGARTRRLAARVIDLVTQKRLPRQLPVVFADVVVVTTRDVRARALIGGRPVVIHVDPSGQTAAEIISKALDEASGR